MRAAAEAPVLVELAVHHQIVAGHRVAAITVDRAKAQSDLRALRQGDARDRYGTSGDAPDYRCRWIQPDHLFDECGYPVGVLA